MVLQKLHAKTGCFTTASKGVSCTLKECRKQCLIGCVHHVITGLTLQASSIAMPKQLEITSGTLKCLMFSIWFK
jgi:hypothetical protein